MAIEVDSEVFEEMPLGRIDEFPPYRKYSTLFGNNKWKRTRGLKEKVTNYEEEY